MYISRRSATVRNAAVSTVNGSVTLVILLIAPLGLAAVIINTLLVTAATYIVSSMVDRIILWMEPKQTAELTSTGKLKDLQRWRR
ncbi:CRISPR-associated protein Csx18 [Umezakia ovalisporum]|jgi:hypothetical protein|uniref:CRISPR-associated protein Csx18 n=1 Tax=Umezakia ovalisporum FSS-62 TaxID=2971776 RepID=A0AA43GWL7_9CYAN|nr:CRISPR-associated protein Csx18 [Umezakia ovalisporum]MBI1240890.1 hypothetical protein [Nostoc sp. RI_552]MDH6063112.1 CRISPR-associated protein Csx18 [Umezakia ovalisporum FSS-62]MDH6086143.1 CRISPR-associated protein Csx18 [Umezakia ovalisporum TAC611]MDH6089788.1 CRISPR-associated protein Csx18 [Umezakia ovalisporum Ak1311]MDH6101856.1 CRISPR-associated protein Csx18 [Umezakia ovalisporum ANA283AFssAo]